MLTHLHGCRQYAGSVDICVSVDLTKLQKLSVRESRNHTQHARLLAIAQMILKTDHAVGVGHEIFLPQLDGGMRFGARPRIVEADGVQGPVAQSVNAAPSEFFNWQTGLEPTSLFKSLQRDTVGLHQGVMKCRIFFFIHRAVQIVVATFSITSCAKSNG